MLHVLTQLALTFVAASQNLLEIQLKAAWILMNVLNSTDRAVTTRFAKTPHQATTANVLKATERDPTLKSHASKLTSTFYVTAILTAQTMPNALKVSVSARKDSKPAEPLAKMSMSAERTEIFAESERLASIFPEATNVSAMPDLLERPRDCHAKSLVLMSSVGRMLTAKSKTMKLSASAKRAGRSCPRTSRRAAWILTSVTSLMDRLECVGSMQSAVTWREASIAHAKKAFMETQQLSALMRMSVPTMSVEKTPIAKIMLVATGAHAPKEPSPIPTQLFAVLLSSLANQTKIAQEMQFATLSIAACVRNRTLETIVAIHARN